MGAFDDLMQKQRTYTEDEYKNEVMVGDCRTVLSKLPDDTFDVVVTSPPYWGLRNYDEEEQIGVELNYEDYVQSIADVCDEVRRVMKPSGNFWLNIGDSYSTDAGEQVPETKNPNADIPKMQPNRMAPLGHKNKMAMPYRVVIELLERGWTLRKDVVWEKSNAKPESVKDRFTESFEYIFHFTNGPDYYFDDSEAREPAKSGGTRRQRSVITTTVAKGGWINTATFPEELVEKLLLPTTPDDGVVLDPFAGSGTTGVVAEEHGYDWTMIEMNEEYAEQAVERIRG